MGPLLLHGDTIVLIPHPDRRPPSDAERHINVNFLQTPASHRPCKHSLFHTGSFTVYFFSTSSPLLNTSPNIGEEAKDTLSAVICDKWLFFFRTTRLPQSPPHQKPPHPTKHEDNSRNTSSKKGQVAIKCFTGSLKKKRGTGVHVP